MVIASAFMDFLDLTGISSVMDPDDDFGWLPPEGEAKRFTFKVPARFLDSNGGRAEPDLPPAPPEAAPAGLSRRLCAAFIPGFDIKEVPHSWLKRRYGDVIAYHPRKGKAFVATDIDGKRLLPEYKLLVHKLHEKGHDLHYDEIKAQGYAVDKLKEMADCAGRSRTPAYLRITLNEALAYAQRLLGAMAERN